MRVTGLGLLLMASMSISGQETRPSDTRTASSGQSAAELHELSDRAKSAGDLQTATQLLCQAAARDERYAKRCDKAKTDLEKILLQFQADLNMSRTEIGRRDYGGAVRDLSRITFGPNKEEAQQLLQQARIASGQISPETASQMALSAARAAYEAGNFDRAQVLLQHAQSPGSRVAANQLITNMQVYRDTMKQAESLARSGDYKGAAGKYGFAAAIQPKGPGQPQEHQREALDAETKAEAAEAKQREAQRLQAQQAAAAAKLPPAEAPAKMNYAARIKSLLAVAQRLEATGDSKGALRGYDAVLKLDGLQKDALAGRRRALESMTQDPQALEQALVQGVMDFYASRFAEASEGIRVYLQGGGKTHSGAAHFFLGASMLSQAILGTPEDRSSAVDLQAQAKKEFLLAKEQHYKPPQGAVSPKILGSWSEADVQP